MLFQSEDIFFFVILPSESFQRQVLEWFQAQYKDEFILEKKIPIGNPAKDHKFDIVDAAGTKAIECKAKKFIDNPPCHIAKEMVERYEKKATKLYSLSPSPATAQEHVDDELDDNENYDFIAEEDQLTVLKNAKSEMQFSNEKLLEDELESRIVQGKVVFGKKLKIFRRPGAYGRQYIIPIGRLDLLAEDDNGNLYVIELKKDSGYDDPYIQTSDYVNWFEKNLPEGIENVFGIICLNSPTKKCIEDVKKDPRIDLYEYAITYTKIE